jgi:hypothetical protein
MPTHDIIDNQNEKLVAQSRKAGSRSAAFFADRVQGPRTCRTGPLGLQTSRDVPLYEFA